MKLGVLQSTLDTRQALSVLFLCWCLLHSTLLVQLRHLLLQLHYSCLILCSTGFQSLMCNTGSTARQKKQSHHHPSALGYAAPQAAAAKAPRCASALTQQQEKAAKARSRQQSNQLQTHHNL